MDIDVALSLLQHLQEGNRQFSTMQTQLLQLEKVHQSVHLYVLSLCLCICVHTSICVEPFIDICRLCGRGWGLHGWV